jgi:hypothetical protein
MRMRVEGGRRHNTHIKYTLSLALTRTCCLVIHWLLQLSAVHVAGHSMLITLFRHPSAQSDSH